MSHITPNCEPTVTILLLYCTYRSPVRKRNADVNWLKGILGPIASDSRVFSMACGVRFGDGRIGVSRELYWFGDLILVGSIAGFRQSGFIADGDLTVNRGWCRPRLARSFPTQRPDVSNDYRSKKHVQTVSCRIFFDGKKCTLLADRADVNNGCKV